MKVGRELDALVAEKVIGNAVSRYGITSSYFWADGPLGGKFIPHYSTDISAAWEVVEELFSLGWESEIQFFQSDDGRRYRHCVNKINDSSEAYLEFAESAPHAICLAALKAVGHEPK